MLPSKNGSAYGAATVGSRMRLYEATKSPLDGVAVAVLPVGAEVERPGQTVRRNVPALGGRALDVREVRLGPQECLVDVAAYVGLVHPLLLRRVKRRRLGVDVDVEDLLVRRSRCGAVAARGAVAACRGGSQTQSGERQRPDSDT